MNIEIIYYDNHLLLLNKPASMPTQPDATGVESLQDFGKKWIKQKFAKKGAVFLEPIHRLDKPVSGLVLFARTSKALSRLNEMMRQKKIQKTYHALVENTPPDDQDTLVHFLVHDDHCARISNEKDPLAKKAVLQYEVLQKNGSTSFLEVKLETGRYHQIRAQLSTIGCPIVGDRKYGGFSHWENGVALHHGKLEFIHPVTQERMTFTSRFPQDEAFFSKRLSQLSDPAVR